MAVDDDRNAFYVLGGQKAKPIVFFLSRLLPVAGVNITSAVVEPISADWYLVINQSELVRFSLRPFRFEPFGKPPPNFLIRDIGVSRGGYLTLCGGGGSAEPQGIVCLDRNSGRPIAQFQTGEGYVCSGFSFKQFPNLATTDDEGRVRFWKVQLKRDTKWRGRARQPPVKLDIPSATLLHRSLSSTFLAVDPRGELVSALFPDGEGRTWSSKPRVRLEDFRSEKPDVVGCAFSPDGKSLAVLCRDRRSIEFWDARTSELQFSMTVSAEAVAPPILFTRDGQSFYVGSSNGVVWEGNVRKRTLRPLPVKGSHRLRIMSSSPNDRWLLTVDLQGKGQLVDLRNPRTEPRTISPLLGRGPSPWFSAGVFDLHSRQLYLVVSRSEVFRYDLESRRLHHLAEYPVGHFIDGVAIHPSSRLLGLIGGTSESTDPHFVHFVDTSTGEIVKHYSTGFDTLTDVEFSPDGHSLLTADNAGKVHYWAVPKLPRKRVGLPLSETAGHIYRVAVAGYAVKDFEPGKQGSLAPCVDKKTARSPQKN